MLLQKKIISFSSPPLVKSMYFLCFSKCVNKINELLFHLAKSIKILHALYYDDTALAPLNLAHPLVFVEEVSFILFSQSRFLTHYPIVKVVFYAYLRLSPPHLTASW